MKKLCLVIVAFIFLLGNYAHANTSETTDLLTKGKWVNKSDGYKLRAGSDKTVERYKGIKFYNNRTFVLDSVKTTYSGEWRLIDNKVNLEFNDHEIKPKIAEIENEGLVIENDLYKSYSGAVAGLLNFYEFSGFPNATPGHLVMVLVGMFFIFLAIKYNYEPLLLIPIGFGIIIGNI
ncbi:MAG: sodium ion-translocating decarboxylase subunit beta, partial [Bacteroidales bacterium]|nr:sodium ion-translocating decarboxylase subunit beta [Bacteroidales bacterium]